MTHLIDMLGEPALLALIGLGIGVLFGLCAQRSAFCLRASAVELATGQAGPRLSVWLLAFCAALTAVQGLTAAGLIDLSSARALASTGSFSGAVIGGSLFGIGMILARGCASRLLVLASTGNLRALISGLVLTLVAQAAYKGVLSPAREYLAGLWTVPGGPSRSLTELLGSDPVIWAALGGLSLCAAWIFALRHAVPTGKRFMAMGVGLAVAGGWWATFAVANASFEIVPIASVTFTGPAMDTLMVLVDERGIALSFGVGLVPGVALGAGLSAALAGDWAIQRFGADTPMERYLIGACLMGFGAMLAGGCAVGAGLSGGAAMSLTAWVAVFFMWVSAMATQVILQGLSGRAHPA